MSPVNNDPSQDNEFSGGRPLTRREIRERERFLATQNQDVVPEPAYAVADVEPRAAAFSRSEAPGSFRAEAPVPAPEAAPTAHVPQAREVAPAVEPVEPAPTPEPVEPEPTPEPEPVEPEPVEPAPVEVSPVAPPAPEAPPAAATELPSAEPPVREAPAPAAQHANAVYHDDLHHSDLQHDEYGHSGHGRHDAHLEPDRHYQYEDHADDGHHHLMATETPAPAPGRSKKVRRFRRLVALLLTFLVFVAAIAVGAQFLKPLLGMDKAADYPGPGTGVVKVSIQPGAGPRAVATTLESQKIVANADTFLKEFQAAGGELTPGDYEFRNEMKNSDAVAVLLNRDASKVMYFALNAGLRVNESLEAIAKGSGIPFEQLKALSDSPAQFGVPSKAKNLEGFLAPGEYRFPLGTPGKDIIQKLVSTTLDELKAQGITDPATQYDAITVASIVQAEGGQADYGNVAGAIYNRLKPGNTETAGLIQSDATVTYGLGRKSFHLEESEKSDKSNPYNTYANPGLPVGPIGSPGKTAIDAAAKPTPNDYLYWVTINLDTKETKFSKTLAEHNVYVEQYNTWCSSNAGRCV